MFMLKSLLATDAATPDLGAHILAGNLVCRRVLYLPQSPAVVAVVPW